MTGLAPAPGGKPNHFRAADYETLVDSPILEVRGDATVQQKRNLQQQLGRSAQP